LTGITFALSARHIILNRRAKSHQAVLTDHRIIPCSL